MVGVLPWVGDLLESAGFGWREFNFPSSHFSGTGGASTERGGGGG